MKKSRTLADIFSREGVGLHTGTPARVTVHPRRQPGRVLVCDGVEIPALAAYVVDTRRCTTLGRDGARVSTVEHLLAALWLAEIDDVEIHVAGSELPALDGSARVWYDAITTAGVVENPWEAPVVRIPAPQWIAVDAGQFLLAPAAEAVLYAAVSIADTLVDHRLAGGAIADAAIREQIVRARTYGLEREVRALLESGLARGGSLDNAVVLTADGYLNAHVWPDEPAWHKVLDLAGDLALCGARVQGQIIAMQAGHRAHVALAERLTVASEIPV